MPATPAYSVDDLLVNESFLNYYFRRNEADVWEWEEFREDNPQQLHQLNEAIALLDRLSLKWTEEQIRKKFSALQSSLTPPVTESPGRTIGFRPLWRWASGVAAAVLLVSGLLWYTNRAGGASPYEQLTEGRELVEHVNTSPGQQFVRLPDGSSVQLQSQSKLSYPRSFVAGRRDVYLDGDAFFEVRKNARQPFFVYAGTLVTRVIGTSFSVRTGRGRQETQVAVRTGKVLVCRLTNLEQPQPANNAEGIVITPNQQIRFDRQAATLRKSLVDKPQLLRPAQSGGFAYKNTPASEVFTQISQAYGIPILFDADQLINCPVTASLTDEPLYTKLDLVCRAIEARYQLADGQIIITGGCP